MHTLVITDEATVAEIDQALGYARQLPPNERGTAWHAFVDKLLEMRAEKNTGAPLTPAFNNGQQ
jgi:predicted secreted protein